MRLIDADKLIKFAKSHVKGMVDSNDIARFPTAYDVEAVKEQVEAQARLAELEGAE